MIQLAHRTRQILGFLTLAALVAGVPTLLARIAHWPLPTRIPSWNRVSTAIQQGDIPATAVIKTIAVLVWVAWLQLMWALIWELVVNVPRTNRGQRTVPAPMVPRSVGNGIGRLVAIILSVGILASSTRTLALAPASTTPLAHRNSTVAALVTEPAPIARRLPSPVQSASRWHVSARDSLWSIAETALGDGSRVHEIIDLNPGINSPRDVRAGVVLTLPRDAKVPSDRQQPVPSEPSTQAATPNPVPTYAPETTITVIVGDTLWDLSETQLRAAGLGQPSGHDIVDYLDQVVAANPSIVDPNLIYPGQQFVLPAIGEPPPAPPAPPASDPATTAPPLDSPPIIETTPPSGATPTTPGPATTTSTTVIPTPTTVIPSVVVTTTQSTATEPPAPTATVHRDVDVAATPNSASSNSTTAWLAGVSGSTALASALLLAHRRRRTRQAARGTRLALRYRPDPDATNVERSLVAAADVALVTWTNQHLLELLERLDPKHIYGGPVAVELSEIDGVELLWDQQNPTPVKPWTCHDGGWTWRLPYDPDSLMAPPMGTAALPGLVTVGTRQGRQLLIDLEAFGTISVSGDPSRVDDFIRSLSLELSQGDIVSNTYVHVVGLDLAGSELSPRVQIRDEHSALEHLRQIIDGNRRLAEANHGADTFRLRAMCGPHGHEATLVIVSADDSELVDDFIAVAQPRSGGMVIVVGSPADIAASITLTADGRACLSPLGLMFDAVGVPKATTTTINELFSDSVQDLAASELDLVEPAIAAVEPTERTSPPDLFAISDAMEQLELDMTVDDDIDEEHAWSLPDPGLLIRVLGAPTVPAHPQLGRLDVSLVAFLACHDRSATEDQVINAVWGGRRIERSTLWNRISKARATLGHFLPARSQSSQLVRLSHDAMTDLDLFKMLADRATQVASSKALELIEQAMDMIDGVPFDAPGYDWAHDHQYFAHACDLIESTALRGIEIALEADDPAAARRIATAALRAVKADEPIYRARMRIEAHVGNLTAVRGAYNELATMLAELADDDSYEPSNTTKSLLGQLVGSTN